MLLYVCASYSCWINLPDIGGVTTSWFRRSTDARQFIDIINPVRKEPVCRKLSIKPHAGTMPFTLPAVG